jgi:hypothetical protein
MLTLDPELEKNLEALAKQEQITPNEIIKRLIKYYVKQEQESELSRYCQLFAQDQLF